MCSIKSCDLMIGGLIASQTLQAFSTLKDMLDFHLEAWDNGVRM
jgi:hypothetical protein